MRVLMLSWDFPPRSVGGAAAHVDGLSRALGRAGHDVVVLTPGHPGAISDSSLGSVRVVRAYAELPWIPDEDVVAHAASADHHLVQLTAAFGSWTPEVVHAHDWQVSWAASTLAAVSAARLSVQ